MSGILSVLFSPFYAGLLLGAVGLTLAIIQLSQQPVRATSAKWGLGLSIAGVLIAFVYCVILPAVPYFGMFSSIFTDAWDQLEANDPDWKRWEGVIAPDFTVTALDGQEVRLSALRGKRVMIVLWGIYTGNSLQEFNALRQEVLEDDLAILAIATKEGFKTEDAKFPVAIVKDLPSPYQDVFRAEFVRDAVFFVDRNGVIQKILTGSFGFQDTFRGSYSLDELRACATAPDFAGEALQEPRVPPKELLAPKQAFHANEVWRKTISGASGLCAGEWDGDGMCDVLVSTRGGTLRILSLDGSSEKSLSLPQAFEHIECGKHQDGPRLLGYDEFDGTLTVVDSAGKKIWSDPDARPVYGAHWLDLDNDGNDDIVLAREAFGSFEALSAAGKKLWNIRQMAVRLADFGVARSVDGTAHIYLTGVMDSVDVFDSLGKRTARWPGRKDVFLWRLTASVISDDGTTQLLAAAEDYRKKKEWVFVYDNVGTLLWQAPAHADLFSHNAPACVSGDLNGDGVKEWVFKGPEGDLLVASFDGHKLASLARQYDVMSCAIAPRADDTAVLVTLTGEDVIAYQLVPGDQPTKPTDEASAPAKEKEAPAPDATKEAPPPEEAAAPAKEVTAPK